MIYILINLLICLLTELQIMNAAGDLCVEMLKSLSDEDKKLFNSKMAKFLRKEGGGRNFTEWSDNRRLFRCLRGIWKGFKKVIKMKVFNCRYRKYFCRLCFLIRFLSNNYIMLNA